MNRLVVIALSLALLIGGGAAFRVDASSDAIGYIGQALSPVQQVLMTLGSGVGEFFEALGQVTELHTENVRLRTQVEAQDALKARIIELERENYDLRLLLSFVRERPQDTFLPARIIAWDPVNLVRAVTIDRGRNDGVKPGMVVVTPLGLVGRVQRVTPATAVVLLITDPSSSVSALVQGSRARGIVDGRRNNVLLMRHIENQADVKTGDTVVTSAIGGSFPEGILIGQIATVTRKDTGTFQDAQILPAVDFNRLEQVLVLTSFEPVTIE